MSLNSSVTLSSLILDICCTAELTDFRLVGLSKLRQLGTAELADFRQGGLSKLRHLGTAELADFRQGG